MITCNEADRIERCVASLRLVCAEVIVVDSGSTDDTRERAAALGARVLEQSWLGFARQKNLAIAQAAQPWVLLLDADEWLEPDAVAALRALYASGRPGRADVVTLRRRTRFLGRVMRFGSFAAEPVERLFRAHCRYEDLAVHEHLDLRGQRVIGSRVRIEHDTARSEAEYWAKLQRYARLWADQRAARQHLGPSAKGAARPCQRGGHCLPGEKSGAARRTARRTARVALPCAARPLCGAQVPAAEVSH